jgi:hypothetical protein
MKNDLTSALHSARKLSAATVLAAAFLVSCSQDHPAPSSSPSSPTGPANPAPAASPGPSAGEKNFGPIRATVPAGWVEQTPASAMRKAQYSLPKSEGDQEDGELTVFYFGLGQGGSVEANIERWIGQISQADGSSSKDKARTSKKEVAGLPVTLVDVSGTYSAGMMSPGPPRPGYRLLGAVAETAEGPWFFKLVGPEKTIAKWASSFDGFINSFRKG